MTETIFSKSAESQLDVYKPAKVLQLTFSAVSGHKNWPHNDGEGDPWWSGSGSSKPYQYQVTFSVTEYTHGSHKTRESRKYNGMDVGVGDWIAGSQDGKCLQIVSVESKSTTAVTVIAEDVDRYNVFRSSTGSPIFSVPGTGVLFTLNGEGLPMIDPLPASLVSSDFYPNVTSRFQYLNPMEHYRLSKDAHTFAKGDVVVVTAAGSYEKANGSTIARTIGVVSYLGPGPNQFKVKPQNQIIDFNPALPGVVGNFIYADTDGDLTTTDTGKVLFLKIKNAVTTKVVSNVVNTSSTLNHILEVNGSNITFSGGNTATTVNEINALSGTTSVTAATEAVPGSVSSDSSDYSYGILGGYIPFAGTINGTVVTVSTAPSGNAAYGTGIADAIDITNAINNASISGLTAEVLGSGAIQLTESNGNAISISNTTNDASNVPFAGDASVTGLPTSTNASSGVYLALSRSDGGAIDLEDKSGTPQSSMGITSKQNGQFPLGLYIEHGVKSSGTTIVANISARDSLASQAGDMAYVTDAGGGEWGLFVYDGSTWVEVGNHDSANTDAQTLTKQFTMPHSGGFGGVDTLSIGNISPGARIVEVTVQVDTPVTNYSGTAPAIDVGDSSDNDAYMTADESDLSEGGVYTASPNYIYPATQTTDLDLRIKITHSGATLGSVTVSVTYV